MSAASTPGAVDVRRGAGAMACPVADTGDRYNPGPRGWHVRLKAGGPIVGARVPVARRLRLGAIQARAARRLTEMAHLASWRARWGVISDLPGWAAVAADALSALQGVGRWRCDAEGLRAQMPPGGDDTDAVAAALAAPHRPGRLLSGREAGRLVELVRLEADDGELPPISTMTARDMDDAELAARRLQRRREGARERKRRERAKCVTLESVTNAARSNVTRTSHAASINMKCDLQSVTDSSPEITAEAVAAALAVKSGAARARLMRWHRAGLIRKTGRGTYGLAECAP